MNQKKLLLEYYKKLINSIYKILTIYENRDYKTKEIKSCTEESFLNYQIYLSNLIVEIYGNSQLFFCSDNSVKLISIMRGMIQEIKIDEHKKVKRLVMQCISLCKKIITEIERDDDIGL